MPHIRMRAISAEHVATLSSSLVPDLAQIIQTPVDNFTFELIETRFFEKGSLTKAYPFVEVLWFARSQEVQDACARLITDKVKALVPENDVAVVFTVVNATAYYENGSHF
jgi:hypothetical protein